MAVTPDLKENPLRRALLAALAAALLVASPVAAASSSITLDQPDPHFGDTVSFTASTFEESPVIEIHCLEAGFPVYYARARSLSYTLTPTPAWQGGPASCSAELQREVVQLHGNKTVIKVYHLASTSFVVAP